MPGALRLVFLGSDPIALPLLDWMMGPGRAVAEVVAVYTQPDRPAGRGQSIQPNSIKRWAIERKLPVHQPEKLTDSDRAQLAAFSADLALVMAYGHILRESFFSTPRLGTLNLHTSILPNYRGASPIQAAIASGDKTTGVTLMRIVRPLDAGPVADFETATIGERDTAADVEIKLARAACRLLERTLPKLATGGLAFVEQNEAQATYCRRLTREDGSLDFKAPAAALAARINGLFPWPACQVEVQDQAIKFGLADASGGDPSGPPGTVLGADPEGLLIATGAGILRVLRLQRPGGRMLPAAEFLRGFPIPPGTLLPSRPMPPLVGPRPF